MDVEYLAERNEAAVQRARRELRRAGGLGSIVGDGSLIDTYGEIHEGRGFTTHFTDYEPTYYRRDTALARDYAWFDRNPVIVFMPFWAETEAAFEEYTGLDLDGFAVQVREGYLIPVFGPADEYAGNPLFERLLSSWDERLAGKDPLFANALERAVLRDDPIANEHLETTVGDVPFWRGEANYLAATYPDLEEATVVQPTAGLKEHNPLRFFAERRFMLRTAGFTTITGLLDELLERFDRSADAERAAGFLDDAVMFAFFSHMVYSGPIYYSMGGGNTYSIDDYVSGLTFASGLLERRRGRNMGVRAAERLFTPLSRHLTDTSEPLAVRIPEAEGAREALLGRPGIASEGEQATSMKRQLQETIVEWRRGNVDRAEVRADRNELHECLQAYVSEVEREIRAPHDAVDVLFEVSGRALSHLPTEPMDDPVTAGMELFGLLEGTGALEHLNHRAFRRRRDRMGTDGPVAPSLINNINVWQVGADRPAVERAFGLG